MFLHLLIRFGCTSNLAKLLDMYGSRVVVTITIESISPVISAFSASSGLGGNVSMIVKLSFNDCYSSNCGGSLIRTTEHARVNVGAGGGDDHVSRDDDDDGGGDTRSTTVTTGNTRSTVSIAVLSVMNTLENGSTKRTQLLFIISPDERCIDDGNIVTSDDDDIGDDGGGVGGLAGLSRGISHLGKRVRVTPSAALRIIVSSERDLISEVWSGK